MLTRFLSLVLLCLLALPALAEVAVPTLTEPVTDLTATLSAGEIAQIENQIRQLEASKGSQIAVLIVPTTQPEAIEQYAIRVAENWKLGRKGVDDGVLLLVAKEDRKLRIEVGYGLEGVIPDVTAKRVITEIITPRFRQQQFAGGIVEAVDTLASLIEGEPLPLPRSRRQTTRSFDDVIPIIFFILVFLGPIMRSLLGRILGAGATGAIAGLGVWATTAVLSSSVIIGAVVFGLVLLFSGGGRSSFPGGPRGGYGGGFGGNWPSGGGGFGGGGFGGGGGGFGGGGASGGW